MDLDPQGDKKNSPYAVRSERAQDVTSEVADMRLRNRE